MLRSLTGQGGDEDGNELEATLGLDDGENGALDELVFAMELPQMAVTNIFVRQDSGEWLLAHHHASPLHVEDSLDSGEDSDEFGQA